MYLLSVSGINDYLADRYSGQPRIAQVGRLVQLTTSGLDNVSLSVRTYVVVNAKHPRETTIGFRALVSRSRSKEFETHRQVADHRRQEHSHQSDSPQKAQKQSTPNLTIVFCAAISHNLTSDALDLSFDCTAAVQMEAGEDSTAPDSLKQSDVTVHTKPVGTGHEHRLSIFYRTRTASHRTQSALAPVIMSTSSFVMEAWRPRLYCIWSFPIMSEAFLDALSMALRRALCSHAWPSTRAA